MTEPTLDDLRRAMAAHTEGLTPAPGLASAARNRVARRRMAAAASSVVAILAAGSVVGARILPSDTGGGVKPAPSTAVASSAESSSAPAALNYRQACQAEGGVCSSDPRGDSVPAGAVPAALLRPLRFPTLAAGGACPATTGTLVDTSFFGGIALGTGPVRPLLAEEPDADVRRGIADLLNPTSSPPWRGFNTLWISDPSYQGPFIVRAQRLDGAGAILQGEGPNVATLVVPPGPTINSDAGWRTAPGGTWVTTPGCYAWQIDGLNFSHVIIVHAVLAPPTTTSPRP